VIRVTIEMWPHGESDHKYFLGAVEVWNTAAPDNTKHRADYGVRVYGKNGAVIRTAFVRGWSRLSRPVFALVARALLEAGY